MEARADLLSRCLLIADLCHDATISYQRPHIRQPMNHQVAQCESHADTWDQVYFAHWLETSLSVNDAIGRSASATVRILQRPNAII